MNILLVDDNYMTIDVLRESIDWAGLGIGRVYLAESMQEAQEILKNQAVDILLCDIEMPHGGGLDLLRWVRGSNYPVQAAFLTCHADFRYAQEAIQLGCQDYILKPVEGRELEPVIRRLIRNMTKNKREAASGDADQIAMDRFWEEVLHRQNLTAHDIGQRLAANGVKILPDARFSLLCFFIMVSSRLKDTHPDNINYSLKALAADNLLPHVRHACSMLTSDCLAVILPYGEIEAPRLGQLCVYFTDQCKRLLDVKVLCYFDGPLRLEQVGRAFESVKDCNRSNIFKSSGFLSVEEAKLLISERSREVVLPDTEQILRLMNGMKLDKTYDYLNGWIRRMVAEQKLNRNSLCAFQQMLNLVVSQVCANYGIRFIEDVMDDAAYAEMYSDSILDGKRMILFLEYLFARLQHAAGNVKVRSLSGQLKNYIIANYSEDITISDIVRTIGVSQEHAMRVFREDFGITIGEYLTKVRIDNAKLLLQCNEYNISQVCMMTGFNSSSYFTKVFKHYTGVKPFEYRKNIRQMVRS